MNVRTLIRSGRYYDSVTLMAVSQRLRAAPGVAQAAVMMGTPLNKEQLDAAGLLTAEAAAAQADDLVIAVAGDGASEALALVDEALAGGTRQSGGGGRPGGYGAPGTPGAAPRTIEGARRGGFVADLAMISVPGEYAAREARLALEAGCDVMLFSNNVALADEVVLKRLAVARGRLLMGPDCGTAMLGGVGLGFANVVRKGPVGIVAASGTGAQELSCQLDRAGSGVSQIIGVGGRDLSAEVGGLMTLAAIQRLQADEATERIIVISKPPAPGVAEAVEAALGAAGKPYRLCLLDRSPIDDEVPAGPSYRIDAKVSRKAYGLFSGGTLCSQARLALGSLAELIDLGEDRYTAGRPHPMIDPTYRIDLMRELMTGAGLFLLDVVLGYGAHPDPAGALAPVIREAVDWGIIVIASVTGTEADPQCRSVQEQRLRAAGARVAPTAWQAALAAKEVLT
jgi:FdrA protein